MKVAHILFEGRPCLVYTPPEEFDTMGDVMRMSVEAQRQHEGWGIFVAADDEDFAKALESGEEEFRRHVMEYLPAITEDLGLRRTF
jgi:hypothetical protein